MRNALGAVQSLVVLGGASDIGAAIAEKLVPAGCRRIVLAGRHPDAMAPVAERLRALGAEVAVTAWDATDIAVSIPARVKGRSGSKLTTERVPSTSPGVTRGSTAAVAP